MSNTYTLELPARLGLGEVKPLIRELRETAEQNVQVDAGNVTHIGTLCLQALIAAARAHIANGTNFTFIATGETCMQQFSLFGLSPDLIEGGLE